MNEPKYKIGDVVVCIDNKDCYGLEKHKAYEVYNVTENHIQVKSKRERHTAFSKKRFKKLYNNLTIVNLRYREHLTPAQRRTIDYMRVTGEYKHYMKQGTLKSLKTKSSRQPLDHDDNY